MNALSNDTSDERYDAESLIHQLHLELHARVAEPVTSSCRIRHSAYLIPEEQPEFRQTIRDRFEEIIKALDIPNANILWGERSGRVETPLSDTARLRVVWELHSEFYTYTTYHLVESRDPEENMLVPPFTFPAMPVLGTKLVDLDLVVLPGLELSDRLREFLGSGPVYGGRVVGGEGRVWTTFQVDERGQGRYVVRAGTLLPGRLGRLIRRLVEIENYFHLILLPLESYRREVGPLREIERRIARRSAEIAAGLDGENGGVASERHWLERLTLDLAELSQLMERMRYKLSAANSYYAIFEERLRWLREQTGEGFQSLEEFLTARIAPAMGNYRNFSERTDALTVRLTSLGNMMRTRISLTMEHQSLATMQAMNRRVDLQLRLQRTVEGLSLIVLSYYLTGLTSHVLKAVDDFWHLPGKPGLWVALSIPLWVVVAFAFTRHATRLVKSHLDESQERIP